MSITGQPFLPISMSIIYYFEITQACHLCKVQYLVRPLPRTPTIYSVLYAHRTAAPTDIIPHHPIRGNGSSSSRVFGPTAPQGLFPSAWPVAAGATIKDTAVAGALVTALFCNAAEVGASSAEQERAQVIGLGPFRGFRIEG